MRLKSALRVSAWLAGALLACGAMWLCGVSLLEIPGDGCRPVFLPGDHVTVRRAAYGLRLTPMRWWGYVRWGSRPVERGEWVAFNDPSAADGYADEQDVFVGFCYAVPGDSIWVDADGRVWRRRPARAGALRAVELPRKDAYVAVTPDNLRWYNYIINRHEGVRSTIVGDSLCVEGRCVRSFRFGNDYYWMAAARTAGGADSRSFGFVPHTHVIGRLGRVLYSWDSEAPWYARLRFGRTLMEVGREEVKP